MRLMILTTCIVLSGMCANAQSSKAIKLVDDFKKGIASFYHDKFEGRKTATGEVFDNDKYTAACNTLKLGSYVKVTNTSNGEVVYVRINDRMAKSNNRLIDLASVAAKKLRFQEKGVAKVKVEVVDVEEGKFGIMAQNGKLTPERKNEL
ncbi:MAG: septal ring lytic transglycosylase RlpA family protein [Sphingobacteriales bacterium]|nr:MAG: septal ring lytic transglycosylase RlpA family protein [Sphingobacteriales bacterium]